MAEIKQYVNLDPTSKDQLNELDAKRAGKIISVKAKLNKKIAGVPIVFEIVSGEENIVRALDSKNFPASQRKKLAELRLAMPGLENPAMGRRRVCTDDEGVARVTFVLSEFGGDEFEVKAYIKNKKGKKELLTDKYIVWRRIYYQVSRFRSGPKGAGRVGTLPEIPHFDWGPVKQEFEARKHNIELVDDSSQDLISRRCNVIETEKDEDLKKSAKEGYDNKREPVSLRCVLINMIAESTERVLKTVTVSQNSPIIITLDHELWVDESKPDKDDFIVGAYWKHVGEIETDWKPFDKAFVEMISSNQIKINFAKIPKRDIFHIFRKAHVKLIVRMLDGSTNGLSWYNAIWIANQCMHEGDRLVKDKQATTIHETGHFIGMVPNTQSTHYTEHGHQGGHCSTGLSPAQKLKDKYWGLPGTCVMFGESAAERKNQFCAGCDLSVRKANIVLRRMPGNW